MRAVHVEPRGFMSSVCVLGGLGVSIVVLEVEMEITILFRV